MKKTFLFTLLICLAFSAHSQNLVGVWKSIDDATNEPKSQIQLYEQNGKIYGKVIKFLRANSDPNRICTKCTDWRKDQKIMDMMIVRDMVKSGSTWKGGKILDPENGKEYTCSMWFEGGKSDELRVRGWVGPFFRTQTWYRVN